jgi:hypothetical protein
MTIRPADKCVVVDNFFRVFEVDPVVFEVAFALFRIPSEFPDACKQGVEIAFSYDVKPSLADACIYKCMTEASRLAALASWCNPCE